ncbi:hypothetical protein ACFL6X_09375 [Candidatus Latescibacterota bacterium]
MTDVSRLGGGYAESAPDAEPTARAVLAAATPGSSDARLVVVAGPPGVGKSAVASAIAGLLPNCCVVDKDWAAAGFILEAARSQGGEESSAYGTPYYWQRLRPHEYGGATATACANLVGTRTVFLVGGWGPELSRSWLWEELRERLDPSQLIVLHLDAPPGELWRQRLAARGSRADQPWFDAFARAVTAHSVWPGALRLVTESPLHIVVQAAMAALDHPR